MGNGLEGICVVGKILVRKNCRIGARNRRNMEFSSHDILSLGGLEIGSFSLVALGCKVCSGVCLDWKPRLAGWEDKRPGVAVIPRQASIFWGLYKDARRLRVDGK